jgi:ppGpp synthetase/RelA/SpoT-type nucleotidyltranferase
LAEAGRTVEDRLREEYFTLLPEICRVADQLEAEIRYLLLPISGRLHRYESLAVESRVKSCESALDKLRRHQETRDFKDRPPETYTLTSLNDLVGVRVLAFPRNWLVDIDRRLRSAFPNWTPDPVEDDGEVQAFKYHGYCAQASLRVRGEYQVVSMLTGLFWKVEHAAIYKPAARLA